MTSRKSILCLLAFLMVLPVIALKPRRTSVYLFGFGGSFLDSVTYVTEIQKVDSVWIDDKTGFLQNRAQYGEQLEEYLLNGLQKENTTCVVFFSEKKKKLEKIYSNVCRKYRAEQGMQFSILDRNTVSFHAVEFIPPTEEEIAAEEAAKKAKKAAKKKSSSKSKK